MLKTIKLEEMDVETGTKAVTIRLAEQRVNPHIESVETPPRLFTPGEMVAEQQGFMRFTSITIVILTNYINMFFLFHFVCNLPFSNNIPGVTELIWMKMQLKHRSLE